MMKNSRLDRTALIAIVLCVAFILLYQPILRMMGFGEYLEPPRPTAVVDTTTQAASPIAPAPAPGPAPASAPAPRGIAAPGGTAFGTSPVQTQLERTIAMETPLYRAEFSSRGGRLTALALKRYASAHGASDDPARRRGDQAEVPAGDRVVLAGAPLTSLALGSGEERRAFDDVVFAAAESTDAAGDVRVVTFTHEGADGMYVRQTYRVLPDQYAIEYDVEIRGVPESMRVAEYSVQARSWPLLSEEDLASDARTLRATSLVGTNIHREGVGGLLRQPKRFEGNARWAVVQTRYFITGAAVQDATPRAVVSFAQRRQRSPEEIASLPPGVSAQEEIATNALVLALPGETKPVNRFLLYAGPAEYFRLSELGVELERAVDLGWRWLLPFSKALLQLLNWIYGLVQNYGVAILILATLVRVVLHPLNVTSMKSMRNMQRLQPEIERIRTKYKKDPQAMNTAMMALYKEHKVNPAGGCLPLVLQMPLFIALYNVLFNAIELRQAPFLWISDLSAPDLLFAIGPLPIRLLPILMLISGLLQQMVTPTPPEQRPMMYIMNVVMLVFFYNLPSGLVLYWTVMNFLTALQQWLVMRQDGPPAPALTPAPAVAGGGGKRRKGG